MHVDSKTHRSLFLLEHGMDPNLNFFHAGALLAAFWSQYPLNFELIEKILEKGGRVRSDFIKTGISKERVDLA